MHYSSAIAASILVALLSGCSSDKPKPDPAAGYRTPVYVPERFGQEFEVTWGFNGRGGAALRKPTYQHVIGTEDVVMTTRGPLDEWNKSSPAPAGVVVTALNGGMTSALDRALEITPNGKGDVTTAWRRQQQLAALSASPAEIQAAYRKFCKGATSEMSERDWEIVALGGPKGTPNNLRAGCRIDK